VLAEPFQERGAGLADAGAMPEMVALPGSLTQPLDQGLLHEICG
jgi:hypothetical protein